MSAEFVGRAFTLGDGVVVPRERTASEHGVVPTVGGEVEVADVDAGGVDPGEFDAAEFDAAELDAAEFDASGPSESELGAGFAAGEVRSLAGAYRRWAPLVYTMARRELGSTPDAEDLTQQVFISAWNSRATYHPSRGSFVGWLVGITRHRLLDHHRGRQRRRSLADELEATAVSAAEPLAVDSDLNRLVLASEIALLPEPRGTIIKMAFWDGYSYPQIADQLRLPLGTVKSHVRRTLLHLRSRLKETVPWTT